jgi:photosystem I subunit 9
MTYLSTAPVVGLAWISFTAGFIIEINRFFPDPLVFLSNFKKLFSFKNISFVTVLLIIK